MTEEKVKITLGEEVRPTGKLKYTLTNDYLFKAFLQRNEKALRGLLCAILSMKEEEIKSVQILNPIQDGDTIDEKTLILDIKLILNSEQIINIEMQVRDLGDWPERSLVYLCRSFDQLSKGEDYSSIKTSIHIGILNFTPTGFPEELFSEYYLMEAKYRHIYTGKFAIKLLQLNQLGKAEDEKANPNQYYWAQLFKATTWEEIYMLAEKNEAIREGIVTLKELSADEKEQLRMEGRERYEMDIAAATRLGESQLNQLYSYLLAEGRNDELAKAISDEKYRETLRRELKM